MCSYVFLMGELSFRLGCGGGTINSAQPSKLYQKFPVPMFTTNFWYQCLPRISGNSAQPSKLYQKFAGVRGKHWYRYQCWPRISGTDCLVEPSLCFLLRAPVWKKPQEVRGKNWRHQKFLVPKKKIGDSRNFWYQKKKVKIGDTRRFMVPEGVSDDQSRV